MGITSALTTGLSGLATSQSEIDVVGNNIANVNTVGFKSSSLDFKTQFLENFSYGTAPSQDLGGTNPLQIGLGTQAGAISKDFSDGSLQVTGVDTNLAIQGNGFFVLNESGQQVYTRDGTFQLNGLNQLVSSNGDLVQGYGVDNNFNIVPGTLSGLTIPLGSLSVAQATKNATMIGNLNSGGALPTSVSDLTLNSDFYLSNGAGGTSVTPPAGTDLLTNLTDSTGNAYFQTGDVITLNAEKGTRSLTPENFTVTSTSTLSDLQSFLTGGLGINTSSGANGSLGTPPGITFPVSAASPSAVTMTVDGNPGTANDLTMDANSITIARGSSVITPFTWTKNSSADGESVTTEMPVYDSLGNSINVDVTAVLEAKTSTGSTWQIFAESSGGTGTGANLQTAVGLGTLNYDSNGHLTTTNMPNFTIDRTNSGAAPSLAVTMDFSGTTALSGTTSSLNQGDQDGSGPGSLTSFSIGTDGVITGSFGNGQERTLGQVALATFQNNEGLIDRGSNTYTSGPNSGNPIITTPEALGAGQVISGSLELSNVDLSSEFVNLISASTAFSASSRVITSADQLLQELLQSTH